MKYALIRNILITIILFNACNNKVSRNADMIDLLETISKKEYSVMNPFCPEARLESCASVLNSAPGHRDSIALLVSMAGAYLQLGNEDKAIALYEQVIPGLPPMEYTERVELMKMLAISFLRIGERTNCIYDHSGESCIFPIAGRGVHYDKNGSEKAIELYKKLLTIDPYDLESKWLLNIAYMTTGGYPNQVPAAFLIKGLNGDTSRLVKPFIDVAMNIGINTHNMAGGSIVDDFNNDGYLDIITSCWNLKDGMHYCRNNTNGTFTEMSDSSGLAFLKGGLNIQQTDYNNDGFKDIFVLRGAWKGKFGNEPKSLLRNNGDGTFTDVTHEAGLLSIHPTQTATWADFNNDGWLDVFIGHEMNVKMEDYNPCELYMNNKNGTFTAVQSLAGCEITAFVKGVTSGDYDNDGWPDIFVSTLDGHNTLLKNEGLVNGMVHFKNVTNEAGLEKYKTGTFPTWFWDYDNDGWLDILACGYEFDRSLSVYAAAEAMGLDPGNSGKVFLYHNNHDGTFEYASPGLGLNKIAFAMGANFGDIDNDGYLDIYLGTGNPQYTSLVPNKMFKNMEGSKFIDITTSARVGNLQKGHGVSFADLDNDGDEDIYIEMGGAYAGDSYDNSLYINPGQNNNHWINLSLEGTRSNRAAIGARIKVTFTENYKERSVYRDVNSGGSFGSNPLRQHIGIGQATNVSSIEIIWPGDHAVQVLKDLKADQNIKIREGNSSVTVVPLRKINFMAKRSGLISCKPE